MFLPEKNKVFKFICFKELNNVYLYDFKKGDEIYIWENINGDFKFADTAIFIENSLIEDYFMSPKDYRKNNIDSLLK